MARVLIVDDSFIIRNSLKNILIRAGHEVVGEVSDGKQAYMAYASHLPDIVTMDITMPVMNGIDAVIEIIRKYPDAKIIMISAEGQKNMLFRAIKSGAKHYIIKPFHEEKVISTIEEVLRSTKEDDTE